MSEELQVLKIVTARLSGVDIRYMVTGFIANNVYAVPRMTRDIDIVVELSEADVDRIIRLFETDFYIDRETVQRAVAEKRMFNAIHQAFAMKVDLVVRKDSEYRLTEFSRRRSVSMEGQEIFFVAPEDLILSKLDWAKESRSEMQLNDVRNLLASVDNLDHEYLAHWVNRLGLESVYREVSA